MRCRSDVRESWFAWHARRASPHHFAKVTLPSAPKLVPRDL
jgi:hypothetical protein